MTAEYILAAAIILLFAIMMMYYSKCKKKFGKILFGFLSGTVVLYPTAMILTAIGAQLSINIFTVSVSAVLGVPGVALLCVSALM